MAEAGLDARRAAAALMTAVTEEGALMSAVLPGIVGKLSPSDRARAQRLATESLRWAQKSDRLLGPHLRNKPEDPVMNLLRLALYEINVEGAPAHGPVNAAVSLAPKRKAGLVNAVLRNVQRRATDWDGLPAPSLPKWLRKRLLTAWGKEAVAEMEAVHLVPAPLDITQKPQSDLAAVLGAEILPTGSLRLPNPGQVSALPGYEQGDWWIQDAAAALPAKVLDVQPGERVLDLCAAPGGKTMQLAAAGADVTALDVSEARMVRVKENLARTGLTATLVTTDALEWKPDAPFDAILLDAPCSATGTLRRHPDLAYAKTGEMDGLLSVQSRLIDRAVSWLKPGGRLVFCTCSLLPEEGEAQVRAALGRLPALTLRGIEGDWVDPLWRCNEGLRICPHHWANRRGIDGFFIASFAKSA